MTINECAELTYNIILLCIRIKSLKDDCLMAT